MPRITFSWDKGQFMTDCERIAGMFARCPESFIPAMRERVSPKVRFALLRVLQDLGRHGGEQGRGSEETIDDIRIRVETLKITVL